MAKVTGDLIQLRGFKTGGSTGQVPMKNSGSDFDWSWGTINTFSGSWNDLQDKPLEFPPAAHTHDGVYQPVGSYIVEGDARLTDSREWTATTVDQAEAEAGVATTRRAWTAQRVRQAIAAWWATVSASKADASHTHPWSEINKMGAVPSDVGAGTIATQNANSVAITGGTISGLNSLSTSGNTEITGYLSAAGGTLYADHVTSRVGIGTNSPTAKLDVNGSFNAVGNATIGGTLTVTGQTELSSSQAADTANSAMTRGLVDKRHVTELLSGTYHWSSVQGDYSTNHIGGSAATTTQVFIINSGTAAGNVGFLRSDASSFRSWWKGPGVGRGRPNWSRRTVHSVKIASDAFTGADTVFRIQLGVPYTLATAQDLQSSYKAIGIKIVAGEIFVEVANGSTVTTVSTGVTMVAWLVYDVTIDSMGDGSWTATVNNTVVTGSGAPTGDGPSENSALAMSTTNGTTAANRRLFIYQQRTLQI